MGQVVLAAVLAALFGAFGGFLFLAASPVQTFTRVANFEEFEEERADRAPRPRDIYYFRGDRDRNPGWEAKRDEVLRGNPDLVTFTHEELNAWITSRFEPGRASDAGESSRNVLIIPGLPNVFIQDEEMLHFSIPVELRVFDWETEGTVFGRASFRENGTPDLMVRRLYLSGAPLPGISWLEDRVIGLLTRGLGESEEFAAIREAWNEVETVEMRPGAMQIGFR